jgi:hypothetical protein
MPHLQNETQSSNPVRAYDGGTGARRMPASKSNRPTPSFAGSVFPSDAVAHIFRSGALRHDLREGAHEELGTAL